MSHLTDTRPLLALARALVIKHQMGSISLVQRHLCIGYNAAAELLEKLQEIGVVGPINGKGGRPVLIRHLTESDNSALTHAFKDHGSDRLADGSQKPNDATAIPRAKAGSKKDAEIASLRADNAVLVDALEWARLYVRDASQRSIGEGIREEAARRLAIIDAAIAKANGDAS